MASRSPNQASSIYQGKDGYWHGRVTVGFRDDGTLDRRHTMSKDRATVTRKVRELEKLRDSGAVAKVGQKWTVASWLRHWLDVIAAPNLRPSSAAAYRTAIEKHLIPGLGKQKLDRLQPEHLERLYRKMIDQGAKPATAHQVHRTMRTTLGRPSDAGTSRGMSPPWLVRRGSSPNRSNRCRWRKFSNCSPRPRPIRTVPGGPLPLRSDFAKVRRWGCGGRT